MPGECLATDYWARHLRQPVRCDLALARLAQAYPQATWLECGPGQALGALARANASGSRLVLASAGRPSEGGEDLPALLAAAAALWCQGAELEWDALRAPRASRRVSLPTTPFARERHWIAAPRETDRSNCRSQTPESPFHRRRSKSCSNPSFEAKSERASKASDWVFILLLK
jgi:acyl transferase domain-containing protein